MRRVPNSTIAHVSASPPFHPGQSDFPSPVGDPGFPRWAFPLPPKLKRWLVYTPCNNGLPIGSTHHGGDQLYSAQSPKLCRFSARQAPRAPLPTAGVTCCGVTYSVTSEGITLPSSLILAHAPDQNPLPGFACHYSDESSQVAVSPCWEMALPNVISVIFVKVLVPIPRGVSLVHSTVSSQRTSASRQAWHVRHTQTTPVMQFQLGILFRGCSNSLMFKLPYSLGPPITPTAMPTLC